MLVKRAFGLPHVPELDPFLLLDEFTSHNPEDYLPGFPFHPHRGIETITWVFHGKVEHRDSLGNSGTIHEGDVQWMTAGSGIIHQEMPQGDESGFLQGCQLWLNLPASHKMMNPRYQDVKNANIPQVTVESRAVVRIVSGSINGTQGPVQGIVANPLLCDVRIPPEKSFSQPVPADTTIVAYVLEGGGYFDEKRGPYTYEVQGGSYYPYERETLLSPHHAILYSDGDEVTIQAGPAGCRFLLMVGEPLNEPVAWGGSMVMNTEEELRTAFEEVRNGTFVKYGRAPYRR